MRTAKTLIRLRADAQTDLNSLVAQAILLVLSCCASNLTALPGPANNKSCRKTHYRPCSFIQLLYDNAKNYIIKAITAYKKPWPLGHNFNFKMK